jgi:hypothetical protein
MRANTSRRSPQAGHRSMLELFPTISAKISVIPISAGSTTPAPYPRSKYFPGIPARTTPVFKLPIPAAPNGRIGAGVKFMYSLPKAGYVSLRVYGMNGQVQSELVNKHQNAGNYTLTMPRGILAAGVYLVVFKAGDFPIARMISLL